jgi:signal transduction histidine kinase
MFGRWLPKSLTLRALTLSSIWAALSLFAVATVIVALNRQSIEAGFEERLRAHLDNLFGVVSLETIRRGDDRPDLGNELFFKRDSGWYWSVELLTGGEPEEVRSSSLYSGRIDSPPRTLVPYQGTTFRRTYKEAGPKGENLLVVERAIEPEGTDTLLSYRVMGDLAVVDASVASFTRKTYFYLSIFGLGSISINALITLFGLSPLRAVGQTLQKIREGKSTRLEGEFPPEIAPLASEMNALIDNNRRIVERSRTQVGNLAHALKTPLAVMSNEGQALGGAKGAVIAEQTEAMQDQIQRYLQRARIGAQRESVVYRAPISPIIAPTLRTMQKLNPEKQFHAALPKEELVFAGEADDFQEIIGNVLENAAKWGKRRIELKASKVRSQSGAPMLSVEISDDGRGLTEKQIAGGIKRGKRLDETKPGTGLGLSIVSDTVREYGGTVTLGRSALGGLSVTFTLPLVE